jgi:hypothetical protein
MKYVLLVMSRQSKKPVADDDGDELSTYEKLKGILKERVREAIDDKSREAAKRELAAFTAARRSTSRDDRFAKHR